MVPWQFRNRKVTCLGECGERNGSVYLWNVEME